MTIIEGIKVFNRFKASFSDKAGTIANPIMFSTSIAMSELCIFGKIGCNVNLDKVSNLSHEKILFSESHSRYILVIEKSKLDSVKNILSEKNCSFSELGIFTSDQIIFESDSNPILELIVDKAENNYLNSLGKIIQNG